MKIKTIRTKCDITKMSKDNNLTIEGCSLINENYEFLQSWLKMIRANKERITFLYNIKGRTMNRLYHLKGDMKYPNELNIICIDNRFYDREKIGSTRFDIGARWFNDIIENYK